MLAVAVQAAWDRADSLAMRASRNMTAVVRGCLALLAASFVSFVAVVAREVPTWSSPSRAPLTLDWLLPVAGLLYFALHSILLTVWLFPGCVVARWVMHRRETAGLPAAAIVAGICALVACGTLYFVPAIFEWPPTWESVARKLPTAIDCTLFVFTWFITFEWLSRFAPPRVGATVEPTEPVAALPRRAIRTTVETISLVAVVGCVAIVGGIAGAFMDFGGDGIYRLDSTFKSPSKANTACVVSYFTPGGALGNSYVQVYLLESAEPWSPTHRGLLVWEARHVDVLGVNWATDRDVRVQAEEASLGGYSRYVSAYSRNGFKVRTEVIAKP